MLQWTDSSRKKWYSSSIDLPQLSPDTFGENVRRMRERKLTFEEAIISPEFHRAQRKLRERLQARDDKILDVVRKGEELQFADWAIFSWRTIPPMLLA